MAYTTATIVAGRDRGRTYTATSRPTSSDVDEFIGITAAEIDSILRGRGYLLPIPTTATSALKLLEGYNTTGALALVESAAVTGAGKSDSAARAWEAAKKMLAARTFELDAPKDTRKASVRGSNGFPATAVFGRGFET